MTGTVDELSDTLDPQQKLRTLHKQPSVQSTLRTTAELNADWGPTAVTKMFFISVYCLHVVGLIAE